MIFRLQPTITPHRALLQPLEYPSSGPQIDGRAVIGESTSPRRGHPIQMATMAEILKEIRTVVAGAAGHWVKSQDGAYAGHRKRSTATTWWSAVGLHSRTCREGPKILGSMGIRRKVRLESAAGLDRSLTHSMRCTWARDEAHGKCCCWCC